MGVCESDLQLQLCNLNIIFAQIDLKVDITNLFGVAVLRIKGPCAFNQTAKLLP